MEPTKVSFTQAGLTAVRAMVFWMCDLIELKYLAENRKALLNHYTDLRILSSTEINDKNEIIEECEKWQKQLNNLIRDHITIPMNGYLDQDLIHEIHEELQKRFRFDDQPELEHCSGDWPKLEHSFEDTIEGRDWIRAPQWAIEMKPLINKYFDPKHVY